MFKKPPIKYWGVPFWSINDKLYPEEVKDQVRKLYDAGYGGGFFHAREGLVTPFLGEEWFKAFEAAVEEGKKHGFTVWIYDELWWPSGFAGGLVSALKREYRAKALVMIPGERAFEGEEVIATFKCKLNEKGLPISYEKAKGGEEGEDLYLTFMLYNAPVGETWFYGTGYVDLLDPEVVDEFIRKAYQPYVERFRKEIGKTIPGVFTDEPNFSASRPRYTPQQVPPRGPRFPVISLPWT
ncbi:MAG TPA: hypothetical protein ENF87_03185, partial [Thermoproteales archaeon]|nr:hypothetical protein [Thermoproteales archaeon]